MSGSIFQRAMCGIGSHSCRTESDAEGVWGQCVYCAKRFGYISRAQLRTYADRELAAGGVKPSPAADDRLSDSHEQVFEQQRSEPISSPSDAQSVRPDGGEG